MTPDSAPLAAVTDDARPRSVTVVGMGLVGTSVALALRRAGVDVVIDDREAAVAGTARTLGAGRVRDASCAPTDVVLVAVPPSATAAVVAAEQARGSGRVYTDVASVKRSVIDAAVELGVDLTTYVPGHPIAGGHSSGPRGARAELFEGRPWVLTPGPEARADAVAAVAALVALVGGLPHRLDPRLHDRAVATSSHVPHLVACGLASLFARQPEPDVLELCGRGVDDATRIAAGDVALWQDILSANADNVATPLREVAARLNAAADALDTGTARLGGDAAKLLLERGAHGRARLDARYAGAPAALGLRAAG